MVEFPNQDHFNGDISSGFVTSQDISICLILGTTTPNLKNFKQPIDQFSRQIYIIEQTRYKKSNWTP